jgi:hypothetical protein
MLPRFLGFLYGPSKLGFCQSTITRLTVGRWTHGANRLQMDADSKLLAEFLSYLQADTARLAHEVSSLGQTQATSMNASKYIYPFRDTCNVINMAQPSIHFAPENS